MSNLEQAVAAMGQHLFDVTIVCTTDDHQASYWMERLAAGVCAKPSSSSSLYPLVLAVSEDWPGGAGNGLGTLYAFQKACQLAQSLHQLDLVQALQSHSVSAALYHTAGKGTRMAPLPASENNNKPGVKLPFAQRWSDGSWESLTVLEAVVKQTGIYAASRKGRLSVFWGDQVFLPTQPFQYEPVHHADILCTLLGNQAPTADEWVAQGLDKYGVIACIAKEGSDRLEAAQVEKVSHETATQMLTSLGSIRMVGPSLGSFSVSIVLLNALLAEYKPELDAKQGKFDTDPHFWMPMTLSEKDYVALMKQKGVEEDVSKAHFARMDAFKSKLDLGSMGLFGAVDVGKDACWWDYGQLRLYSQNTLKLLEDSDEAKLLQTFLGIDSHVVSSELGTVAMDDSSYAFATKAKSGAVKDSILSSVSVGEITAEGAIVVNCAAKKISAGKGAILYNLVDDSDEGIVAGEGEVMVAVTDDQGESMLLKSRMDIDGGKAWKQKLDFNAMSFEDVHKKNQGANIQEIQRKRQEKYNQVASLL